MAARLDLGAVFDASPNPYMVLDGDLRYVAANQAYLRVTSRRRDELIGRRVIDVFPHDPADPDNENARRLLTSLERVLATGETDVLPVIPYRIADATGEYHDHYWSATHTAIRDETGRVAFVLQHTVDVTELHRQKLATLAPPSPVPVAVEAGVLGRAEHIQQRHDALDEDLRRVLSVLEQAPGFLGFLRGPEHVFEIANAAYREMVGERPLVGRSIREALPELGERHFALLDRVYETGEPFVGRGLMVTVQNTPGGSPQELLVDLVFQPIVDNRGRRLGTFVVGNDVTEEVRAQRKAEAAREEALRLAHVLDETRDFVGIADLARTPLFVNAAALELMGLPDVAAACRLKVEEYFVERQRACVLEEVLPAAVRDGYWAGELLFQHQQRPEEIPVLYSIFPLRDGAGTITALATITRDLRAQKAAEAERAALLRNEQAARAQAEQANLIKDQFLATISHELRTPLTAILGWIKMLKAGMLSPEKRGHALDTVERNARVQAQLIEDLLDVSRIMSGKLAMDRDLVDVAPVVSAAVETVRPAADARGVQLEVELDAAAQILGDGRRLQQVVWNLLSNAVKFTPRDGHVRLQVERQDRAVVIVVRDTGDGIAPDFLPHVFERFRQAEGGSARKMGGLGLGLSIVRHVVEAHGGEVSAESAGKGHGATFTVRLPLLTPAGHRAARALASDAAFHAPPALEGMRVLVVDDEEDTREFVRTLLAFCKAKVTVAASTAEALDALRTDRPDVLLSDIAMPEEDGYRLIERVRALPAEEGGRTPAVALTAYAQMEDRTRAMLAGFQNHVTKPVEPVELVAAVAALAPRPGHG